METPGDISNQVKSAFDQGIEYSIDAGNQLGRFSTQGVYKPFGENSLQDIYSGLTLSKSGKNNSLVISPTQQQVGFRGKTGNINYKRKMTDDETISELAFNLNVLPEALNLYGQGSITDAGVGRTTDGQLMFNPQYKAQAGIRGTVGQLDYNMSGAYDPQQGYSYQGDAELNLLKDRLSLRGNVSGSEKEGLESLSAEARAKLLKNLQVSAGYSQSKNNPANFNIGLSYNKAFEEGGEVEEEEEDDDKEMVEGIADILRRVKDKKNRKQIAKKMVEDFEEEEVEYNLDNFMRAAKLMQMGGMSIPGVNGSVVASVPMTLQSQYKKKKK